MQANPAQQQRRGGRAPRDPNAPSGGLRRSLAYLGRQRSAVIAAYGALFLATLAQLAVPQLVQNMIDAVTQGVSAADRSIGEALLINAALFIVLFAVIRGIFSFVQAFMAEKTSHGLAFDLRNEIFSKVQRLSFS
jgi:ATP-binding cassette subfamily B protein